jgi:hypothetical protein
VMSLISMVIPNFFDVVSLLEDYHPRKAMRYTFVYFLFTLFVYFFVFTFHRWMLARIMALNLLSLYTLIFALFGKTDGMFLYPFELLFLKIIHN